MALLLIPLTTALPECMRETQVADIPCNIISTWKPNNCAEYNLTLYNESGINIINITWGNFTPYCNATFNYSDVGTYHYNSSIESGAITVVGDRSMIAAIIILIPLVLGLFLLIGAFSLSQQHTPIKVFMLLLSLLTIFVSFHFAMINVVKYMDFPELQNLIGSTTYWWAILFAVIVTYFIIYAFYVFIKSAARARQERLEY